MQTVDSVRDVGEARRVQSQYHLTSASENDQVIFDCNSQLFSVPDRMLWEYGSYRQVISDGQSALEPEIKAFRGEPAFSAALLTVIDPHSFTAYYLVDHGEPPLDGQDDPGYGRFQNLLAMNNILATNLALSAVRSVPTNCDLLIIAGPTQRVVARDMEKIYQYLLQGGRLLVLFDNRTTQATAWNRSWAPSASPPSRAPSKTRTILPPAAAP